MQSEASACNVPYHRCGVAAGESRTNTVPKKRRNDKKSKKSVSLISDTCGCREKSFTAVLMWYQHAYQVTNYVLHKRISQ